MPTINQNFTNRIRKLAKPSNASQALQPLFEAVSNGFFAIDDLNDTRPDEHKKRGVLKVEVENLGKPESLQIVVSDDGIGLDDDRFDAFCTMDTEFKRAKGGKGVGRLFWLDAFKSVSVQSGYTQQGSHKFEQRDFSFVLSNKEQIVENNLTPTVMPWSGTKIVFEGLRDTSYKKHFPKKKDTFLRYFSAHFVADFLIDKGAQVEVTIDGETTKFPSSVATLVEQKLPKVASDEHAEFGELTIDGFLCHADASKGLEGAHQLHLLGNNRTVVSREIDKLLGVLRFKVGDEEDLVFHGCVSGEYLNQHVNEGRTAFVLDEKKLKELCRFCADTVKAKILPEQVAQYEKDRLEDYRKFVAAYPIYGFADEDTQLSRVPFGARSPEEFAAGLVKHQVRGEEKRKKQIAGIIDKLDAEKNIPADFGQTVIDAAKDLKENEQRALAHHVVKRKLVLDIMERLIAKVRLRGDEKRDFHLEETLHTFICPMRIVGDDPNDREPAPHDLWIVDERLAFTRSFSSDKRLDAVLKDNDSSFRPDVLVWDKAYGLGVMDPNASTDEELDVSRPLHKALIVEFKRPGRTEYKKPEDKIEDQLTKYIRQLKNGEIDTYDHRRVRFADDCQFFCYVVADIVGDLEEQLDVWRPTANGEGRFRLLEGKLQGSTIEVVQWSDLINDAWTRNMASLTAAGLRRGEPIVKQSLDAQSA